MTTARGSLRGSLRRAATAVPGTLVWSIVGAVLAAALVAVSLLLEPALFAVVVAGIVAVLAAAFAPKAFALLAVIVVVLSTFLQNALGAAGGQADEAVIALAVIAFTTRRLVTERRVVLLPGGFWFLGFLALGVISSVARDVSAGAMVESAVLITKGLLFAFALAQLRWTEKDLRVLARAGAVTIVAVAITGLLNLAAPGPWASFVTGTSADYVGGIPVLTGIFQHPAAFGRFCAVLTVAAVAYGFFVRRSAGNAVLVALAGGFAVLTFQVKTIVGLIVSLGLITLRSARPVLIFGVLCIGPLVGALIIPPLAELIGGDVQIYILQDSARSALALGGVHVAEQYFPLGAGFGRYGSFPAGENYSSEYWALGFDHIYGLGPGEKGMFLNDNQWPAILGETGWFGAACFAIGGVVVLVSLLRRVSADEPALVTWLRITGAGWLVLLTIESAASPAYVSPPPYPFVFAAAGIVAALRSAAREREPSTAPRARRPVRMR